ncbi:MAG: S41 family peptidase [Methanoregulaceae archaeon]|nr:S41 family peptidase [Methanoregulaceae archaeon]
MITTTLITALLLNPFSALVANLDQTTKDSVMDNLVREMNARYVMPDIAKKVEGALADWRKKDDYKQITNPNTFSAKVNEILKANVTDAHLRFRYSATPLPPRQNPREPSQEEIERQSFQTRFVNSGFEKVERLPGNVGYVKFNFFGSPEDMARPVEGVMKFLSNTDAMIIDLRDNGGGHPAGVQLFCSYFFGEKPVHLNSIYFREGNRTDEFWTLEKLPAPRYLDRPVFVLVSKRTGSGAEECSYNLQQLKRATLVGSNTWGGANPGGVVRLGDHFSCFIPTGRAINPYTKTNWEGTGVTPHVAVDPAKALDYAHAAAVKNVVTKVQDPELKKSLEALVKELETKG